MTDTSEQAAREDRRQIASVTFNRPEKLNAVNDEMLDTIWQAVVEDLREREDLRRLLLKSTGRYFTAGVVQAVGPEDEFEKKVWGFCEHLCKRPAHVQGVSKLAVDMAYDLDRTSARHMDRVINTPLLMRDNSDLKKKFLKKINCFTLGG